MKTNFLPRVAALIALASITAAVSPARAQDSTATTAPTIQVSAPPPALAYGVSQILQLSQAKVDDGTIIAYVKNSGNSYGLNADQIIYLRQQGISTAVINAMLSQPAPGVMTAGSTVPLPSSPAPQVNYSQPPPQNSGTVGPSVSGIDPTAAAAANYYYYQPYYSPYYSYPYYPAYGYYPGVSVSLGWGGRWGPGWGGWHGGGGWGGGWHGGGGGGWHGGGGGGWHH
jgi:hypothetical protein